MKYSIFFFTIVFCLSCLFQNSFQMKTKQRQNAKEGCVIIYKDCNYEGPRVEICEDQSDFRIINFRDQTSAISLGKNVKATLYEKKDYKGNFVQVSSDRACFIGTDESSFNSKINSIKITKIPPKRPKQGCVRIFEKCYYQGISYMFCNDRPIFPKKYFNSKTASSIWLGENTELELFLKPNMKGQRKSFSQDFDCLDTCIGWMSHSAKSASIFTVVRTQKKFTDEEMQKLEEEERLEESRRIEEAKPEFFSVEYASYGDLDITEKIQSLVNNENHSLTFSAFNDSFGSTLTGVFKTAHLFYWSKGKICNAGVKENEILNISVEKGGNCFDTNYTKENLKIYAAAYGGKDITQKLRELASKDLNFIEAKTDIYGADPLPGWMKTLSVFYEVNNVKVKTTIIEGEKIEIKTEAKRLLDAQKSKKSAEEELKKRRDEEELMKKEAEKKANKEKKKIEEEEKRKKEEEKMRFSIIDAQYGPNLITDLIREKVVKNSLVFGIDSSFPTLPEDYLNMATIFYWSNNKVCYRTIRGDETVTIDGNSAKDELLFCHDPPTNQTKIQVFLATFGGSDITQILRQQTKNPKFSNVKATSSEFGKPLPGWQNSLFVYYSVGSAFLTRIMLENEKIVFLKEIEKAKNEEENKKKELEKALKDAKIEQENKKFIFSIAGLSYGASDFTDFSKTQVKNDLIVVLPNNSMFGDTWVEMKKTLHLMYWQKEKICVLNELEHGPFVEVSKNKENKNASCHVKPRDRGNRITIYAASYGVNDVTNYMRKMFNSSSKLTNYTPNVRDFEMEDTKDGLISRSFSIYFKINNIFFFTVIVDGESIDFLKIYEKYASELEKDKEVIKKADIILANYGNLRTTDRVRRLVELSATSKVTIQANNSIFGDPSPWLLKTASVLYKINGKYCVSNALQNDNLVIDINDNFCYSQPQTKEAKTNVNVLVASYAGIDVTQILREKFVKESITSLTINDESIVKSNLDNRWLKVLLIQYELNGQIFTYSLNSGSVINFSLEESKRKEKEINDGTYFKITHTSYGPLDVTEKVRLMVNNEDYSLKFRPENRLFGDTWKGNSPKYSHVFYLLHNRICVTNSVEYGEIDVGIDKNGACYDEPGNTKSGVKIEAASWGNRDVTEYLRKMSMKTKFSVIFAEDSYFGDPLKTLSIQFIVNGKRFNRIIKEHEVIDLLETEVQESDVKIKKSRAEEELRKLIEEKNSVAKAKQELIEKAIINEKQRETLLKQQEEEKFHLNEEKIALLTRETNQTNQTLESNEKKNAELERKHFIDRTFLNGLKISTPKGTIIKRNNLIVLTNINTGSKLFASSDVRNQSGILKVSGYRSLDNTPNVYWLLKGENSEIQNLETVKIKHRESKTYLYSRKGQLSTMTGQQEVSSNVSNKDVFSDWKIIVVHNYGSSDNLKVGDIIKIKNISSDKFLSTSDQNDYYSGNNQVFVKINDNNENGDDLFVITEAK